LKKLLHILLTITTLLSVEQAAKAQDNDLLPWACSGSIETYWVKGFNGVSNFEWRVFWHNNGVMEEVTDQVLLLDDASPGLDQVQVRWPSNPAKGGLYTFQVTERTAYGCIGTAWEQDIIVNSPSINLTFNDVPNSFFACEGQTAVLDPGANFIRYLWSDGTTNQTLLTTETGTFQVQLTNPRYSCTFHDMNATIHPLPDIDIGPPQTTLFGTQSLTLNADGPNIMNWNWYKYDFTKEEWLETPFAYSPSIEVTGTQGRQKIAVYVTDNNGCVNSDDILVDAANYKKFRIPSAFIPGSNVPENKVWNFPAPNDSDGEDIFLYLNDVEVRVFNRWGALVWQSDGAYQAWDGKDLSGRPLPMDSYHYIIRIKVGTEVFLYKGSVTIVR
jgi:gliding motility-associated-like protein